MDENKKEHLRLFNSHYNLEFSELEHDLREIEQITDLRQRSEKAQSLLFKYEIHENDILRHYRDGKLSTEQGCPTKVHDFSEKVAELEKLSQEFSLKLY